MQISSKDLSPLIETLKTRRDNFVRLTESLTIEGANGPIIDPLHHEVASLHNLVLLLAEEVQKGRIADENPSCG